MIICNNSSLICVQKWIIKEVLPYAGFYGKDGTSLWSSFVSRIFFPLKSENIVYNMKSLQEVNSRNLVHFLLGIPICRVAFLSQVLFYAN